MKVAVTIWKDRISPVFDVSRKILIFNIENGSIESKSYEIFDNDNAFYKVSKLMRLDVNTLICGAISNPLFEMVTSHGIQAIPFTCGHIDDVIRAYLNNDLPDKKLLMPGCCRFRRHQMSSGAKKTRQRRVDSDAYSNR